MTKNKKLLFWSIPGIILLGVVLYLMIGTQVGSGKSYIVKKGQLNVIIESVGELNGEQAIQINIPEAIRNRELRIWQIKIADMVTEGKIVKKGDYIAQLDQTTIANNMRDRIQKKEKTDADLKNARIDSTVTLTEKREEITNSLLDLEYNKIDLEQAKYESGAFQRKTEMAYQKAEIALSKKRRDYLLKQNRLKMRVQRLERKVKRLEELIEHYQVAIQSTRITTPEDGIVMLGTNWDGSKLSKDDEISSWRPLIATLPDMSSVISETYIKEIDISKVGIGDTVRITIDALPDKSYSGKIIQVASIGEEHKGFDMKVFKVIIRLDESDGDLKPGMTCTNHIIVDHFEDSPLIPLNVVYKDSLNTIVYLKQGGQIVKQTVIIGAEYQGMAVVLDGLKEGDKILLTPPS